MTRKRGDRQEWKNDRRRIFATRSTRYAGKGECEERAFLGAWFKFDGTCLPASCAALRAATSLQSLSADPP